MILKKLTTLLAALALAGCAATPGGAPSGKAGSRSVIDGVEVWKDGPPPRPYRVIATVQRQGADNSATYGQEEALIAAEARESGADAVIVLNAVMVVARMDVALGRPILAPKVEAELIKFQ